MTTLAQGMFEVYTTCGAQAAFRPDALRGNMELRQVQ